MTATFNEAHPPVSNPPTCDDALRSLDDIEYQNRGLNFTVIRDFLTRLDKMSSTEMVIGSDAHGYIVEGAMQNGFEMLDDNGDLFAVHGNDLIKFVLLQREPRIVVGATDDPTGAALALAAGYALPIITEELPYSSAAETLKHERSYQISKEDLIQFFDPVIAPAPEKLEDWMRILVFNDMEKCLAYGPNDEGAIGAYDVLDKMNEIAAYRPIPAMQSAAAAMTDAKINDITSEVLGKWPGFEAQHWACRVVHAVLKQLAGVTEPVAEVKSMPSHEAVVMALRDVTDVRGAEVAKEIMIRYKARWFHEIEPDERHDVIHLCHLALNTTAGYDAMVKELNIVKDAVGVDEVKTIIRTIGESERLVEVKAKFYPAVIRAARAKMKEVTP